MSKQVPSLRQFFGSHQFKLSKAGEGNRTLVFSLEGCGSTTELHPHANTERAAPSMLNHLFVFQPENLRTPLAGFSDPLLLVLLLLRTSYKCCDQMGGAGFEPAKALPSDLQSDPFDRSGNPPDPSCSSIPRVVSQFD